MISHELTLTAATDYVVRPVVGPPACGNFHPSIRAYDLSNAAEIVEFKGPRLHGTHDGAGNAAALTDSNSMFPASLVDGVVYNITDGSFGTVTAVGGTNQDTVTATLGSGTDDDWDVGDEYRIVPPTNWVFDEPFVVRTPAGCTSVRLDVFNNDTGTFVVHQVEVLESRLDGGEFEQAGAGDPWIPTGWSNWLLDATESVQEGTVVHSPTKSFKYVAAEASEGIYQAATVTSGKYIGTMAWLRTSAGSLHTIMINYSTMRHYLATGGLVSYAAEDVWRPFLEVYRAGASTEWYWRGQSAPATAYLDDVAILEMDAITLTVTPASDANSLEGTGIRVDGRDTNTVAAANHAVLAASNSVQFKATPRHSLANAQAIGQSHEYLFHLWEDANNYIALYRTTNTLTLAINAKGAGEATDTDATAWTADTEVDIKIRNKGSSVTVERDTVEVLSVAGLSGFTANFTADAYFGSDKDGDHQFEGVISPP